MDFPVNEKTTESYTDSLLYIDWEDATVEDVQFLLDHGAALNKRGSDGFTPFMLAVCDAQDPEIIKFLVARGANMNEKYLNALRPLSLAAINSSNPDILRTLVSLGADVNENSFGITPFIYAAQHNPNPEILWVLVELGADIYSIPEVTWTWLMIDATNNGNQESAVALAEIKDRINQGLMEKEKIH